MLSQGNYYEVGRENSHEKSWGFCGKDCYLDEDAPQTGILRMKEHIHILSDKLCESYLDISLQYKPQVDSIRWKLSHIMTLLGEASDHMCGPTASLERRCVQKSGHS